VREAGGRVELLAYDFEIRLAPGMGASFLRFDLNLPGHDNAKRELRCHLHPGSDELLVPAPLMSPSELCKLFVYGARFPTARRPRTPTSFDVGWLRQTLDRARLVAEQDPVVPPLPSGIGDAMMRAFGLPPSRKIGDLKKALEACIDQGEVASHQPAEVYLAFLRENAARFGL
jgi:hypothetical protein